MEKVAEGDKAFNVRRIETSNRMWLVDVQTGQNFLATKIISHGLFEDEKILGAYAAAFLEPTQQPTEQPSEQPTEEPTLRPSDQPTQQPTQVWMVGYS